MAVHTGRMLSLMILSCMLKVALSETYYIDYENGLDSNSGKSKAAPWKHCPGMSSFNSAQANYTHAAGNKFIFKGGVTWVHAALPLYVSKKSGSLADPDYYGVDTTWFKGATWTRPVFDAETKELPPASKGNVIWFDHVEHIVIDNFEIKNFIWNDPVPTSINDGFSVYISYSKHIVVQNIYAHDWVVRTPNDNKMGGIGGYSNSNVTARNCLVVAPTTIDAEYVSDADGRTSGTGVIGINIVEGCEFVGTTQGIWGGRVVRNNIVRGGCDSYNSGAHENGAWIQNDADFYNNRFYDIKEGVGVYFLAGWGERPGRINIYNNVFFNTPQINLTPQSNPDNRSNQIWFFNNVVQQKGYCIQVGTKKWGHAFATLVIQNNLFISDNKYTRPSAVISILDKADLGENYHNSNNVILDWTEAASLNLTKDNFFRVQTSIPQLEDKGVSFTNITTTDALGVPRPQGSAWDIGAYEFATHFESTDPLINSEIIPYDSDEKDKTEDKETEAVTSNSSDEKDKNEDSDNVSNAFQVQACNLMLAMLLVSACRC